jgi:glycosyltransferase involved in cell wall biosynthesis
MKLAVFTSQYPARIATFFERDMRSLMRAGIDLEVFAIYPHDRSLWRHSLETFNGEKLLQNRVHHLTLTGAAREAAPTFWRHARACVGQASAVLPAAARFGVMPLAKTAYVLPKAWAWAAEHAPRFDHVLAYWGNYAGTCAWAFHQLAGRDVPFSIWLHAGTDLYRDTTFMQHKLEYADRIFTCCDFNLRYMRDSFADYFDRIESKVHVCHHGLDLETFRYDRADRLDNRIVAVGTLSKYKGFEYLLRAVQILVECGIEVTLDLVGGGELKSDLERLADTLGIRDRVRFRGWVPNAEARLAMRDATLLVHPSDGLGDGLPNVVREAMALGTPVIASDVAGLPDALSDECGVLVPPRNPTALADAIAALLNDAAARERIARNARARVEQRYDMWRNGRHLARLLQGTRRTAPASTMGVNAREEALV